MRGKAEESDACKPTVRVTVTLTFWKVPVSESTNEFSGARLASERPARPGGLRGFLGFSAFG